MSEKVRVHAIVNGRVQGVFFRMETRKAAERHGVTGWVRNKADGSVEAVFEGEKDSVEAVVQWCSHGPASAEVNDVEVARQPYEGEFTRFSVRY